MIPLEVPVFSPHSAEVAIKHKANRLELNRHGSYAQGGLTPEVLDVAAISATKDVPLRVMIRPRGPPPPQQADDDDDDVDDVDEQPDFIYSGAEFEEMKEAVRAFKVSGHLRRARGDGFVFGILGIRQGQHHHHHQQQQQQRRGGSGPAALVVDVERNRELVELARPFVCVFHRAFDDVLRSGGSSVEDALRDLEACGFEGVLTSGGPGSAVDNTETLSRVIRAAAPRNIEVIVGGGVRSSNAETLREALPLRRGGPGVYYHSSCLTAQSGAIVDEEELGRLVEGLA